MQAQQKRMIENYIHAYNNFDIAGMVKDLHDDLVFENVTNGEVNLRTEGKAAFTQQAEAAKMYFKERQQTITSWRFRGNTVCIDIDYQAVLATDLPHGLKAGDLLSLSGQSEFVFKDMQIIGITDKS